MNITSEQIVIIKTIIKRQGNIYDMSCALGKTIAQTSRILGFLGRLQSSGRFLKILEERRIPIDLNSGYIFIGNGPYKEHGEQDNTLFPGDYVLVDKEINKQVKGRLQTFCEI